MGLILKTKLKTTCPPERVYEWLGLNRYSKFLNGIWIGLSYRSKREMDFTFIRTTEEAWLIGKKIKSISGMIFYRICLSFRSEWK